MKRYYLQLIGQVQGVGLRHHLYQSALRYNITGWCRNMSNGQVEAQIQGDDIDPFLKEITRNKGYIQIRDYFLKEIDIDEKETKFIIRY